MFTPLESICSLPCAPRDADFDACDRIREELSQSFGTPFAIADGVTGELLTAKAECLCDVSSRCEVLREVARRRRCEFLEEDGPLLLLAIPFEVSLKSRLAVAVFLTRLVGPHEDIAGPAARLGVRPDAVAAWARHQAAWSPTTLDHMAALAQQAIDARRRIESLERETESLSANIASTYEEISLLHRLSQNLRLSAREEDLGRMTLDWLADVVPAESLAIWLLPTASQDTSPGRMQRGSPLLLQHGNCPLAENQFAALLNRFGETAQRRPVVLNAGATSAADWAWPAVRQLVLVSLEEGKNLFGWMAVFNHSCCGEFGTVEASLLSSVGAILGIHSGNLDLYRQQADLFAGIVRALSAAIDAKDPYTCGHSDRVAQVAMRLAKGLGCDAATLERIYLAGLLHDIGKIGIDDSVLRKPDKLSDEEYAHIRTHAEIGHKILHGLGRLGDILPAVLGHHESWDGGGYPQRLREQDIPLFARIVAVADAFDAMASDRPYRKGMDAEKIDSILRAGAGRQWDPNVIDAYFRNRDDVRDVLTQD